MSAAAEPDFLEDLARSLPPTLSIEEVAKVLKCSKRAVSSKLQRHELRGIRSVESGSSRVIIPRSEVLRWMRERA